MSDDRPTRDNMSIEEATVSTMWEIAAIAEVLERKGILARPSPSALTFLRSSSYCVASSMQFARTTVLSLTLCFGFNGCAEIHETADMLNSRMGYMHFEEALQRFGPPTQCAEAGSTKTCTWVYGQGGTVYAPFGNSVVAIPAQAPTARLTFTNDRLSNWQLTGNWK